MTASISPVSSLATADTTNETAGDEASSANSSSASDASSTNGLLDPNEFLNLLVDSLKYQDPLDPTSSADFLTQLASLSQVQTESQIAETDQTSSAANLLGDTVSGSDASGLPVSGTVTGFSLTSNGPALDIGDDSVSLGNVTSVMDPSSTSLSGSAG